MGRPSSFESLRHIMPVLSLEYLLLNPNWLLWRGFRSCITCSNRLISQHFLHLLVLSLSPQTDRFQHNKWLRKAGFSTERRPLPERAAAAAVTGRTVVPRVR